MAVNARVNRTIKPETDEELYHRPEFWAYPTTAGDCEDLVLEKRRELIGKGWPVGALLITVVRQRNGEGHAVLTVLTDRGDVILDNLQQRIRLWSDTDYAYVKRQSSNNAGHVDGNRRRADSFGRESFALSLPSRLAQFGPTDH